MLVANENVLRLLNPYALNNVVELSSINSEDQEEDDTGHTGAKIRAIDSFYDSKTGNPVVIWSHTKWNVILMQR